MYNFLLHLNKQPKSTVLFRPFIKLSFRLRPSEICSSLFGISSFLMEGVIFKIGRVQEIKETHSKHSAQTVGGITCSDQKIFFSIGSLIGTHITVNLKMMCGEGCHLVIWSFICTSPLQIKRLMWEVDRNQDSLVSGNQDLMEEKIMAFLMLLKLSFIIFFLSAPRIYESRRNKTNDLN